MALESLVVIGALLGFLIILMPALIEIAAIAEYSMKEKQMRFAFERITSGVQEADMLGEGARLREHLMLPVPAKLEIVKGGVGMVFRIGEKEKRLEANTDTGRLVVMEKVFAGNGIMTISNEKHAIKLEIRPEKS